MLVLAVDADAEVLSTLFRMLDGGECRVATCTSPFDALKFAAAHKPALAIVGRPKPGGDGKGLIRRLRVESPETRIIRLVERGCAAGTT